MFLDAYAVGPVFQEAPNNYFMFKITSQESTNYLDNHLKEIEKEYRDLHDSNLNKLNERLNQDAREQKETLFEILSSVTDIRMSLEKGQVSSVEKDVKFEDTVKKIEESVEKIKRIEESVKKMIEDNDKKKVNYYSDILGPENNIFPAEGPIKGS